jgi:Fic family protein
MSKSLSELLKKADELKSRLAGLRPLNDGEVKRLREDFMIENTYNTNAIEGNKLTLRETALILQEGMTIAGKPIKDHLEAIGHRDAFDYMISIADMNEPLSERRIKEIHSLVLMNDRVTKVYTETYLWLYQARRTCRHSLIL